MEPLMRPLFRVPGTGGFVWAMGLASGYPAGAKLTARLWKDKRITTIEAERLVAFTNSSNPLFLFGAIAIGFFSRPCSWNCSCVCPLRRQRPRRNYDAIPRKKSHTDETKKRKVFLP